LRTEVFFLISPVFAIATIALFTAFMLSLLSYVIIFFLAAALIIALALVVLFAVISA